LDGETRLVLTRINAANGKEGDAQAPWALVSASRPVLTLYLKTMSKVQKPALGFAKVAA